jgi:hypothetical protein
MYLIRYEKESLKDYMVYNMPDDLLPQAISSDNGFQICYMNNDDEKIRLHFKVLFFNTHLENILEKFLIFINNKFNTNNENWTITINERMLNKDHIISLYFFSNKYYTTLNNLKKKIDNLYYSLCFFDITIYYTYNSKYHELITLTLPYQSNQFFKHAPKYRILSGNPFDLIITNTENLVESC